MKNPICVFISFIIIIYFSTISCEKEDHSDRTVVVTAIVYHKYIDYTIFPGTTTIKGIKIKETNSTEWISLPEIEKFDYVENHEYQVRLQKTYLANPPQDGSNIVYKLDEILSKTPKP